MNQHPYMLDHDDFVEFKSAPAVDMNANSYVISWAAVRGNKDGDGCTASIKNLVVSTHNGLKVGFALDGERSNGDPETFPEIIQDKTDLINLLNDVLEDARDTVDCIENLLIKVTDSRDFCHMGYLNYSQDEFSENDWIEADASKWFWL